ncbi:MAG: hypothetical protein AB7D39_06270 [Pseudodesulfovibrio sp.]|jgi:hypothetical protein|uniref:hypothetical protein n=1 Tax=Pseudodesulfovibrio sp. TaxID=2035812 RepID=UPI003D10723E
MDFGPFEMYTVGVKEFEADTVLLKSGQWTNEYRLQLTRPGVFSVMLHERCLFVGSSMRAVGSYALGYFRRHARCPFWTKEYLAELLNTDASAEIEFVLCGGDKTRYFKAGAEELHRPILSKSPLTWADEEFLAKHFPDVKEEQDYYRRWVDRGITEITSLERFCDSRSELRTKLLDKLLTWYAPEKERLHEELMRGVFSSI